MREKMYIFAMSLQKILWTEDSLRPPIQGTDRYGNLLLVLKSIGYLPWMTYDNYIRVFARYTLAIEVYVHRRYRQSVCNIIICGPSENFLRPQEGFQPYAVMLSEQCFYPLINQLKQ